MVLTEVEEYSMRSAAVNMAKAISVPRSQTGERIVDSYTTVSTIACSLTCCGRACTQLAVRTSAQLRGRGRLDSV